MPDVAKPWPVYGAMAVPCAPCIPVTSPVSVPLSEFGPKSIALYQEGDKLRRQCEARLKDAQARIEQIAFGSDGKPAGLKPFDAG